MKVFAVFSAVLAACATAQYGQTTGPNQNACDGYALGLKWASWTCSDDYCNCTSGILANIPDDTVDCNSKAYKDACGADLKPCLKCAEDAMSAFGIGQ